MDNFMSILSGAPWWVYVIFIYLLSMGIKATKRRTVSIQRMVLFPLFFIALSLYGLYEKVALGFPVLIFWWCLGIAAGAYLGVKEVRSWHFHKDRQKGLITIPGNYSTLVLMLLIFVLKFFWGYFYSTLPTVPYWIYFADTITSSLFTGFFIGRAGFYFRYYYKN